MSQGMALHAQGRPRCMSGLADTERVNMTVGHAMRAGLLALAFGLFSAAQAMALELVMVSQPGCVYCERWEAEIAPAYPNTAEGKAAPLRRAQLSDMPGDLDLARRVFFTPTFILARDGKELSRIEGYPGDNWFWPLLSELLVTHGNFEAPDS